MSSSQYPTQYPTQAQGHPAQHATPIRSVPEAAEPVVGRALDQDELIALAASLARQPERWRPHVAFADGKRHYVNVLRDDHVDVWVLCWTPANDTGWHDHDMSSGAVAVVEGCVVEHNLAIGGPEIRTEIGAGNVYGFGPDHIHRLTGLDRGSVTIHAYSPPLQTMGQYVVDADGMLHRTTITYEDELRAFESEVGTPLAGAAS